VNGSGIGTPVFSFTAYQKATRGKEENQKAKGKYQKAKVYPPF
jgi:hypothetical protein